MKAIVELNQALAELTEELSYGVVDKKALATKVGNVCAVLNIFTDHAFTKEEQYHLFQESAKRLKELEERLA
jgi:hypothetical protein